LTTDLVPAHTPVSAAPTEDLVELERTDWSALPADRHPVLVYLAGLAASGRRSQRSGLERLAVQLSGGRLDALQLPWHLLRYRHVKALRSWLVEQATTGSGAPLSPNTANTYLSALRGVITECWRLGYLSAEDRDRALDFKPVPGTRQPRGRALSRGEMVAVFGGLGDRDDAAAVRDAAMVAVMYSSAGVRRVELARLDLADLDEQAATLHVRGKGNRDRTIYLGDEALAAVSDWLELRARDPGPLFLPVEKDRRTLAHRRLDPSTIRLACQRRAAQAGLRAFSPHDLRRTSISDLLDLTGDLALVSELAGHANPATTRGYDRRPAESRQRAARSLHVPYQRRGGPPSIS